MKSYLLIHALYPSCCDLLLLHFLLCYLIALQLSLMMKT